MVLFYPFYRFFRFFRFFRVFSGIFVMEIMHFWASYFQSMIFWVIFGQKCPKMTQNDHFLMVFGMSESSKRVIFWKITKIGYFCDYLCIFG